MLDDEWCRRSDGVADSRLSGRLELQLLPSALRLVLGWRVRFKTYLFSPEFRRRFCYHFSSSITIHAVFRHLLVFVNISPALSPYTPCFVIYLVARAYWILFGACNPMLPPDQIRHEHTELLEDSKVWRGQPEGVHPSKPVLLRLRYVPPPTPPQHKTQTQTDGRGHQIPAPLRLVLSGGPTKLVSKLVTKLVTNLGSVPPGSPRPAL